MSSLKNFDPESFESDIYIQTVRGLGRGRGFEVVERRSALQTPSVIHPIRNRILKILNMLLQNNLVSTEEITKQYGLISDKDYHNLKEECDALNADLEETNEKLGDLISENESLKNKMAEEEKSFSDKIEDLSYLVADALEEDMEDWKFEVDDEDDLYSVLRYGVERLIEDYEALKASEEEGE